jgi:biotin carboxyl carrier protein
MRKFIINVNGNQYEVEVEEVTDGVSTTQRSVPQPASTSQPTTKKAPTPQPAPKAEEKKEVVVKEGSESVEAPMPGTILSINVNEGDTVTEGQVLAILEAMKMENEILAPRGGKVASIAVTKGASVNTGDKLIVIE